MRRVALMAVLLCAVASLYAQVPQAAPRAAAFELPFSQLKWMSPSKTDSSVQFATLRVASASGATQVLWRFPPAFKGPCEWHAASQSVVVIQGSVVVGRAGSQGTTLGVGGFAFMPRNARFQLTIGSDPTIVLSTLDGRLDFHPVSDTECRG